MRSPQDTPSEAIPSRAVRRFERFAVVVTCVIALVAAVLLVNRAVAAPRADAGLGSTEVATATPTKPGHVFVINLENTGYNRAWGPASRAPYLAQTLRQQGVLLENYYAIADSSLPNYIAQVSGQGPSENTLNGCAVYHAFIATGVGPYGQVKGKGCVYPETVQTIADQLTAEKLSWKGYMEDMGTPCRHPIIEKADKTKKARATDQYTTRHNPFVYFSSITSSPDCIRNDVDLNVLTADLMLEESTPHLSYITPDLCNDGHDSPCADGTSGGLVAANAWLKKWVPAIMDSPAFKDDGMLVITFDEADRESTGPSKEAAGAPLPAVFGPGGGKVGALVLSRFTKPNTSSTVVYNHYSLLGSLEDVFGLPRLAYAGTPGLNVFGDDVYNAK